MIRVNNLSKHFGGIKAVNNINLHVKKGSITGLIGPNGAGKTTSFYMICGLTDASTGSVYIDEVDVTKMSLSTRAKMGIGYLPQESSIFKDLTVEENLMMASQAIKLNSKMANKRINNLLNLFNIEPIRKRTGIQLSGGERRRVEIARALVAEPKFLLLDEPFAGVDPISVEDIQGIIRQLIELDMGVLITDHNVRETLGICDRAYVMRSGEMLAYGTSQEIMSDANVKRYYLGENFTF